MKQGLTSEFKSPTNEKNVSSHRNNSKSAILDSHNKSASKENFGEIDKLDEISSERLSTQNKIPEIVPDNYIYTKRIFFYLIIMGTLIILANFTKV